MNNGRIDKSPFLSHVENFEIADGKKKKEKRESRNVYTNLPDDFHLEEEPREIRKTEEKEKEKEEYNKTIHKKGNEKGKEYNIVKEKECKEKEKEQEKEGDDEEEEEDIFVEKNDQDNVMKKKTIKINRKELKKLFSSQFFTQTTTDGSTSISRNSLKLNKVYLLLEFFKRLFLILLFFSAFTGAAFYIYKVYPSKKHICKNLDLYNYKYENSIRFIPSVSNDKYYVFTGKFPFDVLTFKLRKESLKTQMNEELNKHGENDIIQNIDNHDLQIISFSNYYSRNTCESKIFNLNNPYYLTMKSGDIKNTPFILNEINYYYITNPYNISEKRIYVELINFIKKNEIQNKICFMTSYLKSLKDEGGNTNERTTNQDNHFHQDSQIKNEENKNKIEQKKKESKIENENNNENRKETGNENSEITETTEGGTTVVNNSNLRRTNKNNSTIIKEENSKAVLPNKKIIFLYDSYENNLVDLLIAIYNLQYSNMSGDLKLYWEDIKQRYKIIHPEEIYLLEWYCLAVNYNVIENNNQYKLNCVDLLK